MGIKCTIVGHPPVGDKIYKDERLFIKFIDEGFTEELQRELLLPRHALHASMISFNMETAFGHDT